jgi:hypothetical protein
VGVNAPATLIAKFACDHARTRKLMRSLDGYAREVRFYRELAPEIGLRRASGAGLSRGLASRSRAMLPLSALRVA